MRWDIANTDLCHKCNEEDDLWYTFCNCPDLYDNFKLIITFFKRNKCDYIEFIFGTTEEALNFIYMLAKWTIWRCRFHKTNLSFKLFRESIKHYIYFGRRKHEH